MTTKQKAASVRNWKLLRLKSALFFLKPYLSQYTIEAIERLTKRKIDDEWQADSFKP